MTASRPAPTRLADYRPPAFRITDTELDFRLGVAETRVRARLRVEQSDAAAGADLVLHGSGLETRWVRVDDSEVDTQSGRICIDAESLTLRQPPERFTLATEVRIRPARNRSLTGLYASGDLLCTQCEAEGFRRITWYLDRPDVLARFRVRLTAEREPFPVLLANGNRIGAGTLADGWHWAEWDDPFPKPSYLFALVAGPLAGLAERFTTGSGRAVDLEILARPGQRDRCRHAMRSLRRSMRWDETAYGLEYDLDRFMIVAVDDFNMGAMENKGLNVFNSALILARPDTATDADYAAIESVVAHEYFHNWTGNRVTCRDWFQLSLKEGLTVFRDQQFSEDVATRPVERIRAVRRLRSLQFAEDAGPMAHPVRPDSYIEINNFYTVTIYEKGAELIRMLHSLLGAATFRAAVRRYLREQDGRAATIEDFLGAMEAESGRRLGQFRRWYSQAGTPVISARLKHDAATESCTLSLSQATPPTPGQPDKLPLHIPLRLALLDREGGQRPLHAPALGLDGATETVLELRAAEQSVRFERVPAPPVLSLARGFSAPVRVEIDRDDATLAFLVAHETDPFNRWDATQEYATRLLLRGVRAPASEAGLGPPAGFGEFAAAMRTLLLDPALEPGFIAEAFALPTEANLGDRMDCIAVEAIHATHHAFRRALAEALGAEFAGIRESHRSDRPYHFDHADAGRRRLANLCLEYLMELGDPDIATACRRQLETADNLTDSLAALRCFADSADAERSERFDWFLARWREEPLVLDKWLALQAMSRRSDTLARVRDLLGHPVFDITNPNRVRALVGGFTHGNQRRFHDASGEGYRFLADQVLAIDAFNPQVAARLLGAANRLHRLDPGRQAQLRAELERVLAAPQLSRDSYEIASRTLA